MITKLAKNDENFIIFIFLYYISLKIVKNILVPKYILNSKNLNFI